MRNVLVRDMEWLRDAYHVRAEYLNEVHDLSNEVHFCDYGIQLTRGFRAFKLWMSLKSIGRQGYANLIELQIKLTDYLASRIDQLIDFKRVGQVETAVCCFRFLPEKWKSAGGVEQDRLQQQLQQKIERSGEAWITTTVLNGRRALRVNINSFLTERRHIDDLIELLERISKEVG